MLTQKAPREDLEKRALIALELRRRRLAALTVYGIVCPKEGLLRRIQVDKDYNVKETDKRPTCLVPVKLERFITIPKRFKVAFGGRGAGKSFTFGDVFACRAKDFGDKTLCVRELQNSIEDSVHSLLSGEIRRLELPGFEVTQSAIRLNGDDVFKYQGLSRNPDSVKSKHGFRFMWAEEAQSLSDESIKMLTPTLREAGAELWFSLNPASSADPMAQRFMKPFQDALDRDGFYEDDLHLIIKMNYDDNPWFPDELESERAWDEANLPRNAYRHIWLGDYNDSVDNAIIPVEWFDAAIDAHLKLGFQPRGKKICAHDPSDLGGDSKGLAIRHGSVFTHITEKMEGDVNDGCDWAVDMAIRTQSDAFVWDCDGLGVSLRRQVNQSLSGKRIDSVMFKGSEGVTNPNATYQAIEDEEVGKDARKKNKDVFKNRRAQNYWMLRDRFFNTYRAITRGDYIDPDQLISICSNIENIEKIRSELCRIPKKDNGNGYIQIMTKQEMGKKPLQLPSPNMADSMMMTMDAPMAKRKTYSTTIPDAYSDW